MHFGFQLLRTVNFKLWKHKSVFIWKIIQIILITRSCCHRGTSNEIRKCVLLAWWLQWHTVLKNAAIVIQPSSARINRDNVRVGWAGEGSSVSACPAYLFWEAESSFRVSVPFSALCCALKFYQKHWNPAWAALLCFYSQTEKNHTPNKAEK